MSDEIELSEKIKKKATSLSRAVSIVFQHKTAKIFLSKIKRKVLGTQSSYKSLIKQVRILKHLTHEVENLFDNYYIIDTAISDVLNSNIQKEFKKLPQVEVSPDYFVPRVYLILSELLKISKSKINKKTLQDFLGTYQQKASLSIRELSFVPYILKVILIENSQEIMHKSLVSLNEFKDAEYWFQQITKKKKNHTEHIFSKLTSNMAEKYGVIPVNLSFYLLQKLSQYGPDTRSISKWLKLNLLRQGINIQDLGEIEAKQQNEISVLVSNTIESLRWINQARWDDFIEEVNNVDKFLAKDPSDKYKGMDSMSQSFYRKEIVRLGDRTGILESEIAKITVRLCHTKISKNVSLSETKDNPENHVGYYLMGKGRNQLEKKIGYEKSSIEKIKTSFLKNAPTFYFSSVLLINLLITSLLIFLFPWKLSFTYSSVFTTILIFLINLDITVNLANIFVSFIVPVRPLPRMDLTLGVSESQATFVVVPSMFRNRHSSEELLRRLEVNYLGNDDKNIFFTLLFDFKDSKLERDPNDEILLNQINEGLEKLNKKYSRDSKKFYLFYRRRVWNPQERVFMGWERKRGKLREFNLFLRGKKDTTYVQELPEELPKIKYILTIDEDTRLPKDSAKKLIGCIDHPLNKPVLDKKNRKVLDGYGIIQPRMTTKFSVAYGTKFSKLFSSSIGIDSYSGPTADVYQDLFNNSIFYGKGIYDVDAVELTMGDKIPENIALSHDLLEGLYTKVGFATDVLLFEGFPQNYREYIIRMHRWIRGDWQIVGWLRTKTQRNKNFTFIDKWKILDNLRRSVTPILSILFLFVSYLFYKNSFFLALLYVFFAVSSSFVIAYLFKLFEWHKEITLLKKISLIFDDLDLLIEQILVRFIFLLDQALTSVHAILVSIYRMVFSNKNLLNWQTSHEVSKKIKGTLAEFIFMMFSTQAFSLFCIVLLIVYSRGNIFPYIAVGLWLISPMLAYHISKPQKKFKYKKRDIKILRKVACRTSRLFLEFANREGNYLMPDHFQEEPKTNSPASTSPTNIGMHLLADLSSYDFGYVSIISLLERIGNVFRNLERMERFKGHFYNWYDIRSLKSTNPKYVSSVDSANLLVALLTLKQGILDILDRPPIGDHTFKGIIDVTRILIEDSENISKRGSVPKNIRKIAEEINFESSKILRKVSLYGFIPSVDYLFRVFDGLFDNNEKIKVLVSKLNISLDKGIFSSIYSSVEHLSLLLEQQKREIEIFAPFYQTRRNQPVLRNIKKNHSLNKACLDLVDKLDGVYSMNYLSGTLLSEIEKVDFKSVVHSSALENAEKDRFMNWYDEVTKKVQMSEDESSKIRNKYEEIISLCDRFFEEADFGFLYNKERGLFHIGYNVAFQKIDNSYYDFLASESNSISLISIIKNQVPLKHWFYLGRKLIRVDMKNVVITSWGGSLFEYLTSLIFFRVHSKSILGSAAHMAINSHLVYGKRHRVPWGMGESAYSALDINNNYQYQIFGHPFLGLKRDLKDFLVVAPYTTLMSLAFEPKRAISNLKKLIKLNFLGRYGFYDSVDYTSEKGKIFPIGIPAKIYYAHHQGFSLAALNNEINGDRIRSLLLKDPRIEAIDTILEEKVPSSVPSKPIKSLERPTNEYLTINNDAVDIKKYISINTVYPKRSFISNGSYFVNVSNSGSGSSMVGNTCLTRYRDDPIIESFGQFIYLRDINKDVLWSPTTQPLEVPSGKNKIIYYENKAEFNKNYLGIESSLEISVDKENDVEFRRLTITNHNKDKKNLEITSYGEVSLSKQNQDIHHTTFQRLFVESSFLPKYSALVYSKPNEEKRGEKKYFSHSLVSSESDNKNISSISDRESFIGRGGGVYNPNTLSHHIKNKQNIKNNLDQIFSLQKNIQLIANQTITLIYVNSYGDSMDIILRGLKKYSNIKSISHAIKKSEKNSQETIRSMGISSEQALLYQDLASRVLSPHYLDENKVWSSDLDNNPVVHSLWRLGISGDHPILLVRFYDINDLAVIRNMLLCHKYLKHKGVAYDLVLLNEYPTSYIKTFEDEVDFLIRYNQSAQNNIIGGRVFHLRSSHISKQDKDQLIFLSKIRLDSKEGSIEQQINKLSQVSTANYSSNNTFEAQNKLSQNDIDIVEDTGKLSFWNGIGGFDEKTSEYVMNINYNKQKITPVPWTNIIANEKIGFITTESGGMYTWLGDSYDNRLTKRIDDPLIDRSSEVFYLRDEDTGEVWNPTPLPIKNLHTYQVRHGLGYTTFEHKRRGLDQKLSVYIPEEDGVKVLNFSFKNQNDFAKKLSLFAFFEFSLGGANREDMKDYLKTEIDEETKAVVVRNIYGEFSKGILAFVDLNNGDFLFTNDRMEFLGKNRDISNPIALNRKKLSNKIYNDVDHCVGVQTFFDLKPGEEKEIAIIIGASGSHKEIKSILKKYRSSLNRTLALENIKSSWKNRLDKIKIVTPDESINTLFNTRLLYQTISSRLIAKTGYYQPSGAYGFRDQLQDSMALVWTSPTITKDMILRASKHQFFEGDAQNWWHEHNSFGVRTVFSDHQLWLPHVVDFYIKITNDTSILDNPESYMKGPLLDFINNPSWAGVPEVTPEKYDIYDHCIRAIEKTFVFGKHGLPLIGSGDWNDGLNKVGERGQGESVWLGWFLYSVILSFIPHIQKRGDTEKVRIYKETADNLRNSLEKYAWDGKWYRRAFFDNGMVLGSRSNKEFKIDSVSQSWSLISGAAKYSRAKIAMESLGNHFLDDQNLLPLIYPSLKDYSIDPGYIKDYPPGVRENGAQYNHATLWAAQAFSMIGDSHSMMKIIDSVNPIKRSQNLEKALIYRVEPYVVASDIYTKPSYSGRGGWTWYTGSAGVMYRTILENILGIQIRDNKMEIKPCIPKEWKNYSVIYDRNGTKYIINVVRVGKTDNLQKIKMDGNYLESKEINLTGDGKRHLIEIEI